ncbi:type VI secretion system baseplate subunit TssE [Epibacterium sp. Ofav1-8]|jgi:type VI secretion system protein ImpF|uniref:type VI secretion system baseplate subunit TssE n=1 Tax=Epibacterium sp. Ofav1-8 TaxID=2917735 RepID=UPI001EF5223D|nr:type VI secretion system baseplate subunit TssE [Epibacterium sp. Ofav1-8]MCG7625379.1 type VI secretion system baseplate subunit TssE [Epibacterium sp. Ofav1-8]
MADKTLAERLQPSLLDRLTDDAPSERKETRDSRVIDVVRLREIIQRDLSWLLNTQNGGHFIDEERFPSVSRSVLNYGLHEVTGEFTAKEKMREIRDSIRSAIQAYEPRIIDGSVDVTLVDAEDTTQMTVALEIRADMWAQPMPLELYLRSKVDLTTGEVHMDRRG